jgi:hypothetical protein
MLLLLLLLPMPMKTLADNYYLVNWERPARGQQYHQY